MGSLPTFTDQEIRRFKSYVDMRGKDDCWPWIGRKLKKTGRGQFRARKGVFSAPRVSFSIWNRDLAPEECALHTCDNPNCVNPSHLWVGTQLDNIADRDAKQRNRLRATRCVNGHELTGENIRYFGPAGRWRACKACAREHQRRYRKRREVISRIEAENH